VERADLVFAVVTAALVACMTPPPKAPVGTRCDRACAAAEDDERERTICHACRCKDALGGLPTPDQITCAAGTPIPIYRVEGAGGDASTCANPALLDLMPTEQACTPGSRLGQVVTPTAIFRFICRRLPDGTAYDDMGVIGHNPKTGATCFWTSIDEKRTDGVMPALDVTDGDPKKLDALASSMQLAYEGDKCVACHDDDPFVYTPHLEGAWRFDIDDYRFSPYSQVRIAGPPTRIPHRHLVSEEARACTSCHRIADGRTCETFVPSSAGKLSSDLPYQPALRREPSRARWMPHPLGKWTASHDAAVAHIEKCCANPTAPGCRWAEIP
jgi:hypothetical protein